TRVQRAFLLERRAERRLAVVWRNRARIAEPHPSGLADAVAHCLELRSHALDPRSSLCSQPRPVTGERWLPHRDGWSGGTAGPRRRPQCRVSMSQRDAVVLKGAKVSVGREREQDVEKPAAHARTARD